MLPTWRQATERALYGSDGFYRVTRPSEHFRTSVMASERFAAAVTMLLPEVGAAGGPVDVVDVGAGSGQLLTSVTRLCSEELRGRLRLTAVEVGPRPNGLAAEIIWSETLPESITGLVVANEWLDNVPVEIVELTASGPRVVLVDPDTGASRLGFALEAEDLAWLNRWWPLETVGARAEIGRSRDEAWADVVRRLERGVAIAVDYDHLFGARPLMETLAGYRDGRIVTPVPDGSCDLTAHVALDACAAAGIAAGATDTMLTTQRKALQALGFNGHRPPIELARADPRGYVLELRRAGEEGELIDPGGFGGFGWLVQSVGGDLPAALAGDLDK